IFLICHLARVCFNPGSDAVICNVFAKLFAVPNGTMAIVSRLSIKRRFNSRFNTCRTVPSPPATTTNVVFRFSRSQPLSLVETYVHEKSHEVIRSIRSFFRRPPSPALGLCINCACLVTHSKQNPGMEAYRVNGTPADCVALGTHLRNNIQVVLSGINMGPNLGNAMWHSGTLAAAKQAVLLGKKGIALSTPAGNTEPNFDALTPFIEKTLELLLE